MNQADGRLVLLNKSCHAFRDEADHRDAQTCGSGREGGCHAEEIPLGKVGVTR